MAMIPRSRHEITKRMARILLVFVLALVALSITVLIVIPRATHGTALTVLTGSMTPDIPVGSVVVDRPVDPGTLRVGDIATYQKAPGKAEYITHRIIKIDTSKTPTQFTFKGDANRGPDIAPVPATAIRGKVWFHVPYLGSIRDAIQTKAGLAGVAMVLLAGYAVLQLAGAYKDRRDKKLLPAAEGSEQQSTPPEGASAAASLSTVDAGAIRHRLQTLADLPDDALHRSDPGAILRLIAGAFLDADDETFIARVVVDTLAPASGGMTAVDEGCPTTNKLRKKATLSPSRAADGDPDMDDVRPALPSNGSGASASTIENPEHAGV